MLNIYLRLSLRFYFMDRYRQCREVQWRKWGRSYTYLRWGDTCPDWRTCPVCTCLVLNIECGIYTWDVRAHHMYICTPAEGLSDSETRARSYYITLTPIHWYFLEHWLEVMSETLCVFSLHPNLITDTFWRHWTSDKKRFNEIMVLRF